MSIFHFRLETSTAVLFCHSTVSRSKDSYPENGFKTLRPLNIFVHSRHHVLFLWNNLKQFGNIHYDEIDATSEEIMLFHDLGVVVLRLVLNFNI